MGGKCISIGEMGNAYKILIGKPERKKHLGSPRRRWQDNIRMDLENLAWGVVNWIRLGQDRDQWRALVYTVMNVRVP
jgi:hypothetical protein